MYTMALLPAQLPIIGAFKSSRLRILSENHAYERSTKRWWQEPETRKDHKKGFRYSHPYPLLLSSFTQYHEQQWLIYLDQQFIINASQPASDKIFDVSAFEKFLHDKIKVDNRVGNLGDTVTISQQGDGKIEVVAHTNFSGRYLKYL